MPEDLDRLQRRVSDLEREVETLRGHGRVYRGVRKRSSHCLWGLPLYDIALGPDPELGERRGHARGILAIGDIATGVLALGGVARGLVACGGLAVGLLLAIGGLGTGLIALGGLAIGGVALGGLAIGVVALGGAAWGHYALGGSALGTHVISAVGQDPEALRFFGAWIPGLDQWLPGH